MTEWQVEGTVLIACKCDWGCPCNFNAPPTTGDCEGGWTWLIDRGHFGDVRLDGLALSVYADWPRAIHDGDGRAVAFIDEKADDAQRDALTSLARGDAGGPWAIFITTYELDGPHTARFEFQAAEHESRLVIGDFVELELEPIRNPVTGAEAHPEMILPEGLVVRRASLAASKVFRVKDGVSYDHSGRYTAFAHFDYSGV